MQFSTVAMLAFAASTVSAAWSNGTVVYTTEVVTDYTTYCPASTQVTVNGQTYTVTEATTLTITNCPCTITKAVTTASSVYTTCAATSTPWTNATTVAATSAVASPTLVTTNSGNKAVAFSGFSLAGLLGLAAYVL